LNVKTGYQADIQDQKLGLTGTTRNKKKTEASNKISQLYFSDP
jgi:hypothetical protein